MFVQAIVHLILFSFGLICLVFGLYCLGCFLCGFRYWLFFLVKIFLVMIFAAVHFVCFNARNFLCQATFVVTVDICFFKFYFVGFDSHCYFTCNF